MPVNFILYPWWPAVEMLKLKTIEYFIHVPPAHLETCNVYRHCKIQKKLCNFPYATVERQAWCHTGMSLSHDTMGDVIRFLDNWPYMFSKVSTKATKSCSDRYWSNINLSYVGVVTIFPSLGFSIWHCEKRGTHEEKYPYSTCSMKNPKHFPDPIPCQSVFLPIRLQHSFQFLLHCTVCGLMLSFHSIQFLLI